MGTIAQADIATSAAAMGEIMKNAAALSAALANTAWQVFEKLAQLPPERAPQARTMVEKVTDALTRDEHVIQLGATLKEGQTAGLDLLTSLVTAPPPSPPQMTLPDSAPTPSGIEPTGSRDGLDLQGAAALFEAIRRALEAETDLVLDLAWRLYRRSERAS